MGLSATPDETNSTASTSPITKPCKHTQGPEGYLNRMNWLEHMSARYFQEQCNKCGLWVVWRKKP